MSAITATLDVMAGSPSRMLELLSLLQVRREWAGDVLAERLQVSARTVRRDVERLRDLGYRVESVRGPAGGYRLGAGSDLPPLLFDDEQAVAIALALAVAPASGADIGEAAMRALETIRQVMPPRLRHRVDAVRVDAVRVSPTAADAVVDPEVLIAVNEATRNREVLRFDYERAWGPSAGTDDRPARRVEPHAVVARAGRWYLLAWNPEVEDWSTFRIDRMRPRDPTRLGFAPREIPGGDPVEFLRARFRGSAGGAGWPCVGTAEIDAPLHRIGPFLDEDAAAEQIDARTTRLTMGSWSWRALAARFAGFDAEFRILGPVELKTAAVEVGARVSSAGG
jgi:predicted DNA-binding transcriptional regulator YafY